MPSSEPRPTPVTLTQPARQAVADEWGLYDPEQAGLAALFDRLDGKRGGTSEPDGGRMAASMREANRLAEASSAEETRARDEDEDSPVRSSGRAFLP